MSHSHDPIGRRLQPPNHFSGQRPQPFSPSYQYHNQRNPNLNYRNPNHYARNYQNRRHDLPIPPVTPTRTATTHRLPNFVLSLLVERSVANSRKTSDIRALISQCAPSCRLRVFFSGAVAASLNLEEWDQARSCMTSLWESRLRGDHNFTPKLRCNVQVASEAEEELQRNLRVVFANYVNSLVVGKWQLKLENKCKEITEVSGLLKSKKGNRLGVYTELTDKKKGLVAERELIEKRLKEFKAAMACLLKYLGGGGLEGVAEEDEEEVVDMQLFVLDGEVDWGRIHRLILREIKRLEDGLPIYAHRREILRRIRDTQV